MAKLTTRFLRTLKAREREYKVADDELPRFLARVRASGRIYFGVQYRTPRGFKWMTLGAWPDVTADQARREARRLLGKVEEGRDPAAERDRARRESRAELTVAELAEGFMARPPRSRKDKRPRRPKTAAEFRRQLATIILPRFGRLRAADVTAAQIERLHADLCDRPTLANRVLALTRALFSYAVASKLLPADANPCGGILPYPEAKRERMLNAEELGRLGSALAEAERLGTETPEAIAAVKLLVFTGLRRSEVLGLRWVHVDFERGVFSIRESKTGPRTVVLSAPAAQVLSVLRRRGEWVIAGREDDAPLVGIDKCWRRIRAAAGLEDVRLHDLRHNYASTGVSSGETLSTVQNLLGHRSSKTTERYAHHAPGPLRTSSDAIAARLAAALHAKPAAPLVPLQSRRH